MSEIKIIHYPKNCVICSLTVSNGKMAVSKYNSHICENCIDIMVDNEIIEIQTITKIN